MRTETDLQDAFRALEDIAESYGTPDFHVSAQQPAGPPARSGARRVRVALSSLAAAAAVISAVAVTAAVTHSLHAPRHSGNAGSLAPSPAPTTTSAAVAAPRSFDLRALWFTVRPMSGVVVSGYKLFAEAQQVELDTSGGQHWDVTFNSAIAKQPTSIAGAEAVDIHGRRGFYGYLTGLAFATPADRPVGLVWQYAPGAWSTVVSADQTAISLADATAVAEAVEPGRRQAVTIPIKVGVAPPGMRLEGYVGGVGGQRSTQHGAGGVNALVDFTTDGSGTMFTVDLGPSLAGQSYSGSTVTIAGRTAYVVNGSVTIPVGDYVAHVGAMPGAPALTTPQILAVANSVAIASDPHDPSTWFDATTALP